jgi:hypothetical protein
MKIELNRVLVSIILITCLTISGRSGTRPLRLVLKGAEEIVKTGIEVKVNVTLQNSSSRAIDVVDSVASMEFQYAIDVLDSQGRVPPETDLARKVRDLGYYSSDSAVLA